MPGGCLQLIKAAFSGGFKEELHELVHAESIGASVRRCAGTVRDVTIVAEKPGH